MIAHERAPALRADAAHRVVPLLARQRNDASGDPPGTPPRFGMSGRDAVTDPLCRPKLVQTPFPRCAADAIGRAMVNRTFARRAGEARDG